MTISVSVRPMQGPARATWAEGQGAELTPHDRLLEVVTDRPIGWVWLRRLHGRDSRNVLLRGLHVSDGGVALRDRIVSLLEEELPAHGAQGLVLSARPSDVAALERRGYRVLSWIVGKDLLHTEPFRFQDAPTVDLSPMTQDEFLDYAAGFRDREAEARRAAGLMSTAEAERSAAVDYERLVERGLGDPQVLFLTAWHDGSAVGWLWVELEDSPAGVRARPIDVFVEPSERGAGIGQAILTEVGQLLRDRGVVDVTFRVYGHNRRALALYERAGVTVQRAELRKALST